MTLHGSVALATPAKGHTKPRVYTPPLPSNCDTSVPADGVQACKCGCGLTPETSWGFECIDFLETVLKWTLIPYQKWLYIHALEKDEDGTSFRFETIVILIARQNGKTQWLKGLGLWKLYVDGAEQVLITAQNLELAEKTLSEAVADVKACRPLRREYRRFSTTNGKFKLILKPRKDDPFERPREWGTAPATDSGGRSLSVDLAMLDELRQHHNWSAWNAITPTTQSRPRSLVVAASNAGTAKSVVLRSLRDGATAKITLRTTSDTQTGLFEWSVPEDEEFDNPEFWPMANPGLGYLPGNTIRRLLGKLENLQDNIAGFKTEYLCMWVASLEPGIIPAADWKGGTDPKSRRAKDAPVWASVDVNFQQTKAYVCVSAPRSDGNRHWEVIAAERGTDWLVPWFEDGRLDRFAGVVVQERGAPASALIDDLRKAGGQEVNGVKQDGPMNVVALGGSDLTDAYTDGLAAITHGRVRHRPSPALDAAAAAAPAKYLGDVMVIDRKKSPVDASPIVGCIQAEWGASQIPEPVLVSAYETGGLTVV